MGNHYMIELLNDRTMYCRNLDDTHVFQHQFSHIEGFPAENNAPLCIQQIQSARVNALDSFLSTIVFIEDDCSFYYAHTWSKSGISNC